MKKLSKWDYAYLVLGIIALPLPLVVFLTTDNSVLVFRSIIASIVGAGMLSRFFKAYREMKENDNEQ